jgi:hypothetical protein
MQKIYSQGSKKMNNLQPKQETINFILNYSKAMHIMKTRNMLIEVHKN